MTPVQALIKNLVSVALLIVLFKKFEGQDRPKLMHLLNVVLASILLIFLVGPMKSISSQPKQINEIPNEVVASKVIDTTAAKTVEVIKKDTVPVNLGPKKTKSGFSNIFPNIDSGKQILCFFAPSCDHCRATAKTLTEMKKANKDFPAIQIIFMDEAPEEIPDFFKFAGAEYPNYVMDIVTFWSKLGNSRDVPGVFYLWNGSTQKIYHGIEDQKFNAAAFKKILAKDK
jgi:thiol-disulfide isomerase/thioredoxin